MNNYVIEALENRALILWAGAFATADQPSTVVNSVTSSCGGGENFTKIVDLDGPEHEVTFWWLSNPTAGNCNITVNWAGTVVGSNSWLYTLGNVNQALPTVTDSDSTDNTVPYQTQYTVTKAGSLIFSAIDPFTSALTGRGPNQASFGTSASGFWMGSVSQEFSAGDYQHGYNTGANSETIMVGVMVEPVGLSVTEPYVNNNKNTIIRNAKVREAIIR